MAIGRHGMCGLVLGLSLLAEAGLAQTGRAPTNGAAAGIAPVPTIQPVTGGRIGQPPANSAMRRAGSIEPSAQNPMGMADMSLSAPGPSGGGTSGSDPAGAAAVPGRGGMGGGGDRMGQANVRITDTGITERPSDGGGASNR